MLQIFFFGQVKIIHLDLSTPNKITRAGQTLLAYLLLQRDRSHPRELLADLFWGDHSQDRARRCLNSALWRLRRVLEPEGVPRGTYLLTETVGEVAFNLQSDYWLDVAVFEDQVNKALSKPVQNLQTEDVQALKSALSLYKADLLEGLYDDWVLYERERLRRLYLNSLACLMQYYQRQQAYQDGIACGQQILEQDPLREEIHRQMMRLYLASGQRARAVQQYRYCCEMLAAELGISPMAETRALYKMAVEGIVRGQNAPVSTVVPITYAQALQQLQSAKQILEQVQIQLQQSALEFKNAHDKLDQATQLVEQLAEGQPQQRAKSE